MHQRIGSWRGLAGLVVVGAIALGLTACGGGSSSSSASAGSASARALLEQTFSGPHQVKSGVLRFSLSMNPTGSSTLKGPISFSLEGPFQSRGAGNLPASNFNLSLNALGHHGALGVVSTGTTGYLTLQGAAYQLPAASFQKLARSFSGASGGGSGGLSQLGINPLHWLTNPSIVGNETVGGAATSHIRASVNVAALLSDLNTFLQKASTAGAAGQATIPTSIPQSTRQRLAAQVKNPAVDVWTGNSDKTLRQLSISLNLPVTGQFSILLGGLSSAGLGLTLQYANLNQPQTISAPSNVQPFAGFVTKLRTVLAQVQGGLGGAGLGLSGAGSSGSTGSGSGSPATVQNYTKCIQQAAGDVTKMQKCASLLGGG